MVLFFLRHAEAESASSSDFERRLTPKGLDQAEKVGKFCVRNGLLPDVILSSPLVRARQTAEAVANQLGASEPIIEKWIACGMFPEVCQRELSAYSQFSQVLLVGHEPDFSQTIAFFLGLPGGFSLHVRKSSLTCVDCSDLRPGKGRLEFSLPVRLM